MALLNITYFKRLGEDQRGNVMPGVPEVPSAGGQVVSYTTNVESQPIPRDVNFVRLLADADAYIQVGVAGVAATVNSMKLQADREELFALNRDLRRQGTLIIAVYDGSS